MMSIWLLEAQTFPSAGSFEMLVPLTHAGASHAADRCARPPSLMSNAERASGPWTVLDAQVLAGTGRAPF